MKLTSKQSTPLALAAALIITAQNAHAGHLYAGITDTNSSGTLNLGDALAFVSNTLGTPVAPLPAQVMSLAISGPQTGLYFTTGITWTALAAAGATQVSENGTTYIAANAFGATPGSYIQLQVSSVTGPAGAHFGFFDHGNSTSTPTFSVLTGSTGVGGTYNFLLTNDGITYADSPQYIGDGVNPTSTPNGTGTPGNVTAVTNPFGHIHGRVFTADQEGTYTVNYVLHDLAGNQADSAPFSVTYSAVPEPASLALLAGSAATLAFIRRRTA